MIVDGKIVSFEGAESWLSNFHPCRIPYDFVDYPSAEHAFQAQKSVNKEEQKIIAGLDTPGKAKRYGAKVELRADWNEVKVLIMYNILSLKFTLHKELCEKLKATCYMHIQEGNSWNDKFYGVNIATGEGYNILGNLLMIVRSNL